LEVPTMMEEGGDEDPAAALRGPTGLLYGPHKVVSLQTLVGEDATAAHHVGQNAGHFSPFTLRAATGLSL